MFSLPSFLYYLFEVSQYFIFYWNWNLYLFYLSALNVPNQINIKITLSIGTNGKKRGYVGCRGEGGGGGGGWRPFSLDGGWMMEKSLTRGCTHCKRHCRVGWVLGAPPFGDGAACVANGHRDLFASVLSISKLKMLLVAK